MKHLDLVLFVF